MSENNVSDYLIVGLFLTALLLITVLIFLLHSTLFGPTFARIFARFPQDDDQITKTIS